MGGFEEVTGSQRQKMMSREAHRMETTQIDRGGEEPRRETQQTATRGRGVGGGQEDRMGRSQAGGPRVLG